MSELDVKAEIESLVDISTDYLINDYLPAQLKRAIIDGFQVTNGSNY